MVNISKQNFGVKMANKKKVLYDTTFEIVKLFLQLIGLGIITSIVNASFNPQYVDNAIVVCSILGILFYLVAILGFAKLYSLYKQLDEDEND
jgi:hypothetical protein